MLTMPEIIYELYDFILDDNSLTGVDVTNNIKGVSSINALFGMATLNHL